LSEKIKTVSKIKNETTAFFREQTPILFNRKHKTMAIRNIEVISRIGKCYMMLIWEQRKSTDANQGTNIIESAVRCQISKFNFVLGMLFINSGISKPTNNQKPENHSRFGKNTLSNNKTKPQN
jgi:hypothetical protein